MILQVHSQISAFHIQGQRSKYIFWLDSLVVRPKTKWAFGLSDFSKLIEYIISMIFWPTTKMALAGLAVTDFSKFDWVHFLIWFFDSPTKDKIGLWSFWLLNNWRSTLLLLDSMIAWPTTKMALALPDISIFYWLDYVSFLIFQKLTEYIFWWFNLRQNWPLVFLIFKKGWLDNLTPGQFDT